LDALGVKKKIPLWLLTDAYAVANNAAMKLSEWLRAEHGRQVRLAAHLNVKPPVVAGWLSGRRPVPYQHAAAIEQFTSGEVSRRQLFPDQWQRIWPELADGASQSPTQES